MNIRSIRNNDLAELAASEGPVATILLPMHESGPDVRQNHIRFKNALQTLEGKLEDYPNEEGLKSQVEQLRPLVNDDNFWQHQSSGLACFIRTDGTRMLRCGTSVSETVEIADEPVLTPLLAECSENELFYVIVVSQNSNRLLRCTRDTVDQIQSESMPESLDDIRPGETGKGFQLHSFRPADGMADRATPHGHERPDEEEMVRRYFRRIDEAVREEVESADSTVVFAGVEEHFPLYKECSEHRNLYCQPLPGNHENCSNQEVQRSAWELAHESFHKDTSDLMDRYGTALASSHGISGVEAVHSAAEQGAVDTLLVNRGHLGEYESSSHQTVNAVLRSGGKVILVEEKQAGDLKVGAILRYPLPAAATSS